MEKWGVRKRHHAFSQKYLNFVLSSYFFKFDGVFEFLGPENIYNKLTLCGAKLVTKLGFHPLLIICECVFVPLVANMQNFYS